MSDNNLHSIYSVLPSTTSKECWASLSQFQPRLASCSIASLGILLSVNTCCCHIISSLQCVSHICSFVADLLVELLQVGLLVLEEVDFLLSGFDLFLLPQDDGLVAGLLASLQFGNLVLVLSALDQQFSLGALELSHAVLSLELLLHREVN